jgi:asparagine synthase (glutamine-hydrolysing)
MCGIAGILGIDGVRARAAATRMQAALRHRGPDDQGLELISRGASVAPAVLVHTRLSIIDLSPTGHQPMRDVPPVAGGTPNWLIFNGEIYNFRELARELDRSGVTYNPRSDTSVILAAYRQWGTRAVERFEGMFAFCLLDTERGLVWFCRDRLGIKPLYFHRPSAGGVLFASEVRALLASELVPRRVRHTALESFLAQGAVISEDAIVEGVSLLPPGESLVCDFEGKEQRSTRYWSVAFGGASGSHTAPADGSQPASHSGVHALGSPFRSEVVAELGLAIERSIGNQLLADVPVGLFLSAGIDSSAIATMASRITSQPLRTLSVGFDVLAFDESAGARRTAEELHTDHRAVALSGQRVLEDFENVLEAVDQPTVDGFNMYHVAGAARASGLTVALSGLGGDELFGGYATFTDLPRALRVAKLAQQAPAGVRQAFAGALRRASSLSGLRPRSRALMKFAETLQRPADLAALYFLRRELFPPSERRNLWPLPAGSDAWSGIEHGVLAALSDSHADRALVDRIAHLETAGYMRHMLLRDADVFSMAHGLELRVPLLEHYVVEQAARADHRWRVPNPWPKPLLVDAVGPRLPSRVVRAKKRGFTFPWSSWLAGPLRARVEESLSGSGLSAAGFEPMAARSLWRRFLAGDTTVAGLQILGLVVLESHLRQHRLGA